MRLSTETTRDMNRRSTDEVAQWITKVQSAKSLSDLYLNL